MMLSMPFLLQPLFPLATLFPLRFFDMVSTAGSTRIHIIRDCGKSRYETYGMQVQ